MNIKQSIRDFVNFNVADNYYDDDRKEELVEQFKEILFEDNVVVRKFLKEFFDSTKQLADHYGLIAKIGDVEDEEEPEDDMEDEEMVDEPIEEPEEEKTIEPVDDELPEEPEESDTETKNESIWYAYVNKAADFLYE